MRRKFMKFGLIIFLFLFGVILVNCGKSSLQSEQTAPTDFVLNLEKTQCLGNCPVYKLEVLQNGFFSFEEFGLSDKDSSFTESKGKIENTISQEKIDQLIFEVDKVNFFSLSADVGEAGNCATDHSTVIISIQLRGKEKKINHDLGCAGTADLNKLEDLENKIDEIVETKRWIGERKH